MAKPPTALQVTMQELGEVRARMKVQAANTGEPAVEIPMEHISVFKSEDGQWRAVMRIDHLIHLVDRLQRE